MVRASGADAEAQSLAGGATVFPEQKAEPWPAAQEHSWRDGTDITAKQDRLFKDCNSFWKVKTSILLCHKYYSLRFGTNTIPNPFSAAPNWVKI